SRSLPPSSYLSSTRAPLGLHSFPTRRSSDLEPGSRILDIGAGPGTLAIPLAGIAAHVTAVEPAAGMAEVMAEYAEEKGVSNLKRSEEHTSELQSRENLVCRLLLEKKKK